MLVRGCLHVVEVCYSRKYPCWVSRSVRKWIPRRLGPLCEKLAWSLDTWLRARRTKRELAKPFIERDLIFLGETNHDIRYIHADELMDL